ncbi:sugar transferase [Gemmatimonadota bacterium]
MKRLFDIVGASVLFTLSLPLLMVAAAGVKLSSSGPVFFDHKRIGKGGEEFRCLKLRTMVVDAEEWLERDPELKARHVGNGFKLPRAQDPRVTPLGHFLRFSHIDELPQLLNVLKGEMSLVGPRPIVEEELEWYGERRSVLLSVRPGVFGPWTGQGKRRVDYPERAEVELEYVRDHSVVKDVAILLRNVPVVLTGQVEEPASETEVRR